jgi:DNA-binding protein HU-beta
MHAWVAKGSESAVFAFVLIDAEPVVTLKHPAEWAGYNHGVAKKQAIEMFTGFVADIGRVLKKGSKICIPNLGVLQIRIRPPRPACKGRNPVTGEEIQIKASEPSKKIAFRVAKGFERSNLICPEPLACYRRRELRAEDRDRWTPVVPPLPIRRMWARCWGDYQIIHQQK